MTYAEPGIRVAQTNLQLYLQMESHGYAPEDVAAVASAYHGAIPYFSAKYRANGKPFITHLVGTASLLVSRRAPLQEVLAALLHAAFQSGDLGVDPGRRGSAARRTVIRQLVGADAEVLVYQYDVTDWKGLLASGALSSHDLSDPVVRGATYVFLANTLEDFLDGGMCGLAGTRKVEAFNSGFQEAVLTLADDLSWPELGLMLRAEFDRFNDSSLPRLLSEESGYSSLVLPPSAKQALGPRVRAAVARVNRRWRRTIDR